MRSGLALLVCGGALALGFGAFAQPPAPKAAAADPARAAPPPSARDYRPPPGIGFRAADFISENVRLTAQWFYAAENEGRKLPTVIIAHGWGGTAANFRQDAVDLARAGYLVMLFDYRGWGDSDGRVMLTGQRPAAGGTFNAGVRELRGYIDPEEQSEDWLNAISYAVTDPMVDAGRIGIRGSSFSGGHVVHVAARDPRVKALVSQVPSVDSRPYKPYQPDPARTLADANAAASRIATGREAYPAPQARAVGNLVGAPVGAKVVRWAPVEDADRVTAAALFVLAENEELFSNANNGRKACEFVMGPRKLMVLPKITHYGVYGAERERAINAAIDWFDRWLKPAGARTRVPLNPKEPERGECNPPPEPPKGEEDPVGAGDVLKVQPATGRWN